MTLLQKLIQMLTDLVGGIPMDILGDRAEDAIDEWFKKRRRRHGEKSPDDKQCEKPCENGGK